MGTLVPSYSSFCFVSDKNEYLIGRHTGVSSMLKNSINHMIDSMPLMAKSIEKRYWCSKNSSKQSCYYRRSGKSNQHILTTVLGASILGTMKSFFIAHIYTNKLIIIKIRKGQEKKYIPDKVFLIYILTLKPLGVALLLSPVLVLLLPQLSYLFSSWGVCCLHSLL